MGDRRFVVELIKPSHYDDDGYVIQWWKSWIPSNSLACLYGIASDIAERRALGPDVAVEIHAYDECHTVIPIRRHHPPHQERRTPASSAWSACSRTNFRGRWISRLRFAEAGIAVAIGGFHVSGCLAMLPAFAAGSATGARSRDHALCRRGRGPARGAVRRRARRVGCGRSTITWTTCRGCSSR